MSTLILMCGPAASGKSYNAKKLAKKFDAKIFSSDDIREELYGDANDQSNNEKVFRVLHRRIKNALSNGENAIYDATNLSMRRRVDFLNNELKNIPCRKLAYVCIASLRRLQDNNLNRERRVPISVISKHLKNFECPQYFEDFDDINFCFDKNDDGFRSITSILEKDCNCPHDNPHHSLSIKDHIIKAKEIAKQRYPYDSILALAAEAHDIGKYYCKHFKENNESVATYYGHQNVSAYYLCCSLCLAAQCLGLEDFGLFDLMENSFLTTIFLVNYHMIFFTYSEKRIEWFKELVPDSFFKELEKLHECDLAAH